MIELESTSWSHSMLKWKLQLMFSTFILVIFFFFLLQCGNFFVVKRFTEQLADATGNH